jgi:tetratricopeptide (TPR) repeat protein
MLGFGVWLLLMPTAMAAEPSAQEQARALVRSAKAEFSAGHFDEAAQLLERAVAIGATPETLYNLGRAREKAGHLEAAVEAYRRYLEAAPDAKDRGATQATIDDLTKRIEEKRRLETLEAQPKVIVVAPPPAPPPLVPRPRPPQLLVGGLGVAGLAAGVVLGVIASRTYASGVAEGDAFAAAAIAQRAQGFALGANVAYALGGAVLLAAVAWWLLGGRT